MKEEINCKEDIDGVMLASQAGIEPASTAPEAATLSFRPLGHALLF
jgi:hypothetical protein